MESTTIVNIDGQLIAFCQQDKFKKYVRNAISDELWMRELLEAYKLSSKIDTELSTKIPEKVRSEVKKVTAEIVPSKVESELNSFVLDKLPNHVKKEMKTQIVDCLAENKEMTKILDTHTNQLNIQLYNTAVDTLNKVANEEQYHMTTNSHLMAMQQKCDKKISEINQTAVDRFDYYNKTFETKLQAMQHTYENKMLNLTTQLSEMNSLKDKIKLQESQISGLQFVMAGVMIVSTAVGFFALNR